MLLGLPLVGLVVVQKMQELVELHLFLLLLLVVSILPQVMDKHLALVVHL